jgi:HEAT repeat protein
MGESLAVLSTNPNINELVAKRDTRGLINALNHKDAKIRTSAAINLGKIGDEYVIDTLWNATHDCEANVRSCALRAIAKINIRKVKMLKEKKDTAGLAKVLQTSQDLDMLITAVNALGEIGGPPAIEALNALLKTPTDSRLHLAIAKQLKKKKVKTQ